MINLNKPASLMLMTTLLISSIMVISSTNWLFLWMAMEINMLSFIPLMTHSKLNQETEAAIKYFMAQALGSSMMLMSSMSQWTVMSLNLMNLILLSALLLKLGMAPFHFWFPSVMTSLSWTSCTLLATWQKLAPLTVMAFILNNLTSFMFIAMLNALLGGMMGMNQSHLRTIMAYSSITHMGWMSSMLSISKPILTMIYYILYSMIIIPLFLMMNFSNQMYNHQFNKLNSMTPIMQLLVPIMLLSLSGMPPFTGFIPKWITIWSLTQYMPFTLLVLIFGAMMNTYFYMNILFNSMLSMNYTNQLTSTNMTNSKMLITFATMSLFIIPLCML